MQGVPLLCYQMTINGAFYRNRSNIINNWNNYSAFFWTNKVIYILIWQSKLLIWFKRKITDNYFNFIGG